MPNQELAYSSAAHLLQLISSKQVSPVELTKLFLERIDRLDPQLNSYLLVTYDQALAAAKAAEDAIMRGDDDLGPLHGLPISVKDTQMTKGIPTTTGSLLFKDRIPHKDAAVIERVKDAGAIILGKTNTSEFALVGMCENRLGDHGRNPWNPDYTPGGSSGGAAAATAAFLCPFATGGDGGGSIRIPASLCGLYGIKPTQGRVSGYSGAQGPPSPNLFGQQGPLSRTVPGLRPAPAGPGPGTIPATPTPSATKRPTSSLPSTVVLRDSALRGAPITASRPSKTKSSTSPPTPLGSSRFWEPISAMPNSRWTTHTVPLAPSTSPPPSSTYGYMRHNPRPHDDPLRKRISGYGIKSNRRRLLQRPRQARPTQSSGSRRLRAIRSHRLPHPRRTRRPRRPVP